MRVTRRLPSSQGYGRRSPGHSARTRSGVRCPAPLGALVHSPGRQPWVPRPPQPPHSPVRGVRGLNPAEPLLVLDAVALEQLDEPLSEGPLPMMLFLIRNVPLDRGHPGLAHRKRPIVALPPENASIPLLVQPARRVGLDLPEKVRDRDARPAAPSGAGGRTLGVVPRAGLKDRELRGWCSLTQAEGRPTPGLGRARTRTTDSV